MVLYDVAPEMVGKFTLLIGKLSVNTKAWAAWVLLILVCRIGHYLTNGYGGLEMNRVVCGKG